MEDKAVVIRQEWGVKQVTPVAVPSAPSSGMTCYGHALLDWNYVRWPRYQGAEVVFDSIAENWGDKFVFDAQMDPYTNPWQFRRSDTGYGWVQGDFTITWPFADSGVYPLKAAVVLASYSGWFGVETFIAEEPPTLLDYQSSGSFNAFLTRPGEYFRAWVVGLPATRVPYVELGNPPSEPPPSYVVPEVVGPVDGFNVDLAYTYNYHPAIDTIPLLSLGLRWIADWPYSTPPDLAP